MILIRRMVQSCRKTSGSMGGSQGRMSPPSGIRPPRSAGIHDGPPGRGTYSRTAEAVTQDRCSYVVGPRLGLADRVADRHQHRGWQVLPRHARRVRGVRTNLRRERQLEGIAYNGHKTSNRSCTGEAAQERRTWANKDCAYAEDQPGVRLPRGDRSVCIECLALTAHCVDVQSPAGCSGGVSRWANLVLQGTYFRPWWRASLLIRI
jgi:hypothetical protein